MRKFSTLAVLAIVMLFSACGKHSFEDASEDPFNETTQQAVVGPLLQTKWNQYSPYNDLFPSPPANYNGIWITDNRNLLVTDCGTTAMVQILAFHRHPVRAVGQSTNIVPPDNINVPLVNFESYPFDWANMRNTYTNSDPGTEQERKAVAELMFIFGMARGNGVSFLRILVENFGYDRSIQYHERRFYTDAEWGTIIRQQLDKGLPLLYYGNSREGDHNSVIDGYDNTGKFHINWGWGGIDDGYYFFDVFPPNGNQSPNRDNRLISFVLLNIMPDRGSTGSNEFGLNSFTVDKTSISQNELLTVSFRPSSLGFFPGGQFGTALVDNNGNIAKVIGIMNFPWSLEPGSAYTLSHDPLVINGFVPETVNAGQYKLRIVSRLEDGDWKIVTLADRENNTSSSIPFTVTSK